jgi:hypothetical protein
MELGPEELAHHKWNYCDCTEYTCLQTSQLSSTARCGIGGIPGDPELTQNCSASEESIGNNTNKKFQIVGGGR